MFSKNDDVPKNVDDKYNINNYIMTISKKVGGELVKTGSFGCVFKPPLKCLNPSSGFFRRRSSIDLNEKFKEGYVSKLMTDLAFNDELYEVIAIYKVLKPAGDAWIKKYFVLPLYEDGCVIDIKNEDNIKDITEASEPHTDPENDRIECHLQWNDIKKKVKDYRSLNMVDGGIDLEDF